jgi:hypothetical protein
VFAALSLTSLVVRFRVSTGREKLQLQLWLLGALFAVTLFIVAVCVYAFSSYYGDALFNTSAAVVLCPPVLAGIAIARHRLYGIDVVLNRALTYGLLTAIIAGAYAALVLGVGALASGHGTLLAAIAAALCALAFAPLRAWLQRAVNRLRTRCATARRAPARCGCRSTGRSTSRSSTTARAFPMRRRPASGSTRCASVRPSSAGRARSARRPGAARACARDCPCFRSRAPGLTAGTARR